MTNRRVELVARRLSARIDELDRALAHAGATPAERSRLLELAAVAAMRAVSLAALAGTVPERPRRPASAPPPRLSAAA